MIPQGIEWEGTNNAFNWRKGRLWLWNSISTATRQCWGSTSGIFVLGVDRTEQQRVANMFNCESGSSPMKSLGIPVSNRKVLASDFEFWRIKSQKILPNCQQVSSGGRSALIDPWLDNIPNHTLGFYLLSEGTHHKAGMVCADFFFLGRKWKRNQVSYGPLG
jgi:hypothetical protein